MYNIKELKSGNCQKDSLVVMSGGMDSTLILLREVKRIKATGGNISVVYHDSCRIIKTKREKELESIRNILSKIKKEDGINIPILIHTSDSNVESDGDLSIDTKFGGYMLPQSIVWTSMLLSILPDLGRTNTNVLFGFNLADNFHGYSANMMKKTIEEYYKLMIMGDDKYVLNVAFPLIDNTKDDIYGSMLDHYYEYYDMTWTCEMVGEDGKECGTCVPCKTKAATLRNLLINRHVLDGADEYHKANDKIKELYALKHSRKEIDIAMECMKYVNREKNTDNVEVI